MRYPSLQRLTSLLLAGVYALLATGGQGLHAISHFEFAHADSGNGAQVSLCGCGHTGCRSEIPSATATEDGLATRGGENGQRPHDEEDCSLCQSLAQMKTAAMAVPVAISIGSAEQFIAPSSEGLLADERPGAFDARGPPVVG